MFEGLKRFKRKIFQVTDPRDFLLEQVPRNTTCIEIGTWKGDFALRILEKSQPEKLYLVDPYVYIPEYESAIYGGVAGSQERMDTIYCRVARLFNAEIRRGQVEMVRELSDVAVEKFKNESIDWIYIDGDHSYEFAWRDLNNYFPKVKAGGYLTGDDYMDGEWFDGGVKKAVDQFIEEMGDRVKLIEIKRDQFIIQKV